MGVGRTRGWLTSCTNLDTVAIVTFVSSITKLKYNDGQKLASLSQSHKYLRGQNHYNCGAIFWRSVLQLQ